MLRYSRLFKRIDEGEQRLLTQAHEALMRLQQNQAMVVRFEKRDYAAYNEGYVTGLEPVWQLLGYLERGASLVQPVEAPIPWDDLLTRRVGMEVSQDLLAYYEEFFQDDTRQRKRLPALRERLQNFLQDGFPKKEVRKLRKRCQTLYKRLQTLHTQCDSTASQDPTNRETNRRAYLSLGALYAVEATLSLTEPVVYNALQQTILSASKRIFLSHVLDECLDHYYTEMHAAHDEVGIEEQCDVGWEALRSLVQAHLQELPTRYEEHRKAKAQQPTPSAPPEKQATSTATEDATHEALHDTWMRYAIRRIGVPVPDQFSDYAPSPDTSKEGEVFPGHLGSIGVTSDGALVLRGWREDFQRWFGVWDSTNGGCLWHQSMGGVSAFLASLYRSELVCVREGSLAWFDAMTGEEQRTFDTDVQSFWFKGAGLASYEGCVLVSQREDTVCMHPDGTTLWQWPVRTNLVASTAQIPRVLLLEKNKGAMFVDLASGEMLGRWHVRNADRVLLTSTGEVAITASWSMTLNARDAKTGELLWKKALPKKSRLVRSIALSPDERWLAVGTRKGEIFVLDFETRKVRQTLLGHFGQVTTLEFSHDGQRLYSASDDQSVMLWDMQGAMADR